MRQIFIDESGTHKKDGRSVVALVYLSVNDVSPFEKAIVAVEHGLGIECFHWSHSAWDVRRKFVEQVSKHDFSLKIAFLKSPFHESFSYEHVLSGLISEKDILSITIDGRKSRLYERHIKKVLGSKGLSIRKLKTANDQSYPVLRVSDACAGIARYRDEHPADERITRLYECISRKVSVIIEE